MKSLICLLALIIHSSIHAVDYRVIIESKWDASSHFGLPNNAHFSPVVAVSHNGRYNLLPIGAMATPGLELVAELGRTNGIMGEIDAAKNQGSVGDVTITQNQFVLRQEVQTFEVSIDKDHPYLSFVSMIAPSPDWIVGLSAVRLYTKGVGFSEGTTRDLHALDAGTEDGDFAGNFSIRNDASNPQGVITKLTGEGFNTPFATVTIERIR